MEHSSFLRSSSVGDFDGMGVRGIAVGCFERRKNTLSGWYSIRSLRKVSESVELRSLLVLRVVGIDSSSSSTLPRLM